MRYLSFSLNEFVGWFISMILWLPVTIGGWLVHFNVMSMDNMWLASIVLSLVIALWLSCNRVHSISTEFRIRK
jgi:hypothetical protein